MKNINIGYCIRFLIVLSLLFSAVSTGAASFLRAGEPDTPQIIRAKINAAIAGGIIAYKLTERSEILQLLGPPQKETQEPDGGMMVLFMHYPGADMVLGKMKNEEKPFTLRHISATPTNETIDIGRNRPMVLRTPADLDKLDHFDGLQNVSLKNLDLRDKEPFLRAMTFDTLTQWPPKEKLPPGFDPHQLLQQGKQKRLGIDKLHAAGLKGKGVGIAIIDQPLLLGHREYTGRLVRYDATGMGDYGPKMHSAPIASIAVGNTIGVAPEAELSFYAVPMWEDDNIHFIAALKKITALNTTLPEKEKIRVVGISTGMFPSRRHAEEWKTTVSEAESSGILVVTCGPDFIDFGMLAPIPGKDPAEPESYTRGYYSDNRNTLLVPGDQCTLASHRGNDVYVFDVRAGRSWGAPFIAGLAALAFQVNPDLTPAQIKQYLLNSAHKMEYGPVINPEGFIAAAARQ